MRCWSNCNKWSKIFNTYTLDQLLDSLIAHEKIIAQRDVLDVYLTKEKGRTIAL